MMSASSALRRLTLPTSRHAHILTRQAAPLAFAPPSFTPLASLTPPPSLTVTASFQSIAATPAEPLFTTRFHKLFGRLPKARLDAVSLMLCAHATQNVDTATFIKELEMADSYYSWFLVSELHVWLWMVRLMGEDVEPKQGKFLKKQLVHHMWVEAAERAKKLGGVSMSDRKASLNELHEEFSVALILYDCGLMGDDKDLANAVWRRFLLCTKEPDVDHIVTLANYIRRTAAHLESLPIRELASLGPMEDFRWLPLKEKK